MYHDFGFSLAFAVTYHKIQGKTVTKLILDLNNNSQVPLQLQSLYVGISRVRCSKDLRILPPLSSSSANMVHLTRLHHREDFMQWLTSYSNRTFQVTQEKSKPKITIQQKSAVHAFNINIDRPSTRISPKPHSASQSPDELLAMDQLSIALNIDVQKYLYQNNMRVINAAPDGHCLMNSWAIATGKSLSDIQAIIANEFLLKNTFYSNFDITEQELASYLSEREHAVPSFSLVFKIGLVLMVFRLIGSYLISHLALRQSQSMISSLHSLLFPVVYPKVPYLAHSFLLSIQLLSAR